MPSLLIVRLSGIARPEMVGALDRLRRGERAGQVLYDRFISGFALAGTAEQVIAQAVQYRRAGADELALSFAGPEPAADAAHFRTGCQTPDTGWRNWRSTCAAALPIAARG